MYECKLLSVKTNLFWKNNLFDFFLNDLIQFFVSDLVWFLVNFKKNYYKIFV